MKEFTITKIVKARNIEEAIAKEKNAEIESIGVSGEAEDKIGFHDNW